MRILICGINFFPEQVGIGKYTGEMAFWLAEHGHEVRVVTAPPYYPRWRVGQGYSGWRYKKEMINGVLVWRCPVWVPEKPDGLKRIVHLLSFALSSFFIMLGQLLWQPDLILTIEPPFFCAPGALLAAKICKAKAWLHVQDFEINAAFDLGLLTGGWMHRFVLYVERKVMRFFDRVSTVSETMMERVIAKGVAPEKVIYFPNWVDTTKIFPLQTPSIFREKLKLRAEDIVAMYSGNIGMKQGIEILAEAAQNLKDHSKIQFVFCGEGAGKSDFFDRVHGLPNVRLLDLQPEEMLNELLNLADIHLLPQRSDAADSMMPSKLTGMLASGRPVIATATPNTQLAQVVKKCGVVVAPGDAAAFAKVIVDLAANQKAREKMGAASREYARQYCDKEKILQAFENELRLFRGSNLYH